MLIESINIDNDFRYIEGIYYVPYRTKSRYVPLYVDKYYFYVLEKDGFISFYDKRAFKIIDNNCVTYDTYKIVDLKTNHILNAICEDRYSYLTTDGLVSKDEYQYCFIDDNFKIITDDEF